eukprot:scaffold360945_cov38-Prasinocladus_malaysianus.AAC.1
MADYHKVYEGQGETTEWDDLMVKHGIKEAPPPKWKPEKYKPEEEPGPKDKEWLDERDEKELSDLEDDFDDDAVLAEYRWVIRYRETWMHGVVANWRKLPL